MNILDELKKIYPHEDIITGKEELYALSQDATHYAGSLAAPICAVYPTSTEQISKTLELANRTQTPVVTRAAGTNHAGGCLPIEKSIIICITKMNKILEINTQNLYCIVEPGVVVGRLQQEVEKKGLFYPPDPSNLAVSTIGGSVALSSGGPRTFKYGTTKDYVIDLEVVLSDGKIINTGIKTSKNVAGYNLTQLFVGSEGTLGIITKATLKLIPKPEAKQVLFAYFDSIKDAANSVTDIINNRLTPDVIDLLDKNTLNTIEKFYNAGLLTDEAAALLIEIDGFRVDIDYQQDKIIEILRKNSCSLVNIPKNEQEAQKIWTARRSSFGATAKLAPNVFTEDIVVPRDKIPLLIDELVKIFDRYEVSACIMGHAGDGNIHPNIPIDLRDPENRAKIEQIKDEIFSLTARLGGTITGEHGVGIEKAKYLDYVISKDVINIMLSMKNILDPKGILNPKKIFKTE